MLNEKIKISNTTRESLSVLIDDDKTFDDVIVNLLVHYNENEEFTDAQAEFYNEEIEKFENGDYENLTKLTTSDIKKRIKELEKGLENEL